jgi:hypothetical protein
MLWRVTRIKTATSKRSEAKHGKCGSEMEMMSGRWKLEQLGRCKEVPKQS